MPPKYHLLIRIRHEMNMLVTYVLENCPGCHRENCFGNVNVGRNGVLRGCRHCRFHRHVYLPPVRKKVIYLDQFFFSGAFRGGDERFVRAATVSLNSQKTNSSWLRTRASTKTRRICGRAT